MVVDMQSFKLANELGVVVVTCMEMQQIRLFKIKQQMEVEWWCRRRLRVSKVASCWLLLILDLLSEPESWIIPFLISNGSSSTYNRSLTKSRSRHHTVRHGTASTHTGEKTMDKEKGQIILLPHSFHKWKQEYDIARNEDGFYICRGNKSWFEESTLLFDGTLMSSEVPL